MPIPQIFHDADENLVPYDGSALQWRVSAYGVIIRDNQVLLLKSTQEKLCDIPGGGVEWGESLETALQREGIEEAGAQLKIGKQLLVSQNFFYHRIQKKFYQTLQFFFAAEVVGNLETPTDSRTEWVKWVPLNQVTQYQLPQAVQRAITLALQQ